MKRLLRALAAAVALAAISAGLTGCDASPYAAEVNGQVIKQIALLQELKAWARAPGYVQLFDGSNSVANGGNGLTVAGVSPGATYNSTWVANQLNGIIEALVIHQHLAQTGALPDQELINAARSMSEIAEASFWYQLSPAFRQTLVQRLAEQAALTPVTVAVSTLQKVYTQYQQFFYSQVCVVQAAVFDQAQAVALSVGGGFTGEPICYSQADLENQTTAYQQAVLAAAVGQTTKPLTTSYGYQVVKVVSRIQQPFSPELEQVISAIVAEASGSGIAPIITQLVTQAKVKVNPAYGAWHNGQVSTPSQPPPSSNPSTGGQ